MYLISPTPVVVYRLKRTVPFFRESGGGWKMVGMRLLVWIEFFWCFDTAGWMAGKASSHEWILYHLFPNVLLWHIWLRKLGGNRERNMACCIVISHIRLGPCMSAFWNWGSGIFVQTWCPYSRSASSNIVGLIN